MTRYYIWRDMVKDNFGGGWQHSDCAIDTARQSGGWQSPTCARTGRRTKLTFGLVFLSTEAVPPRALQPWQRHISTPFLLACTFHHAASATGGFRSADGFASYSS